jgi:hypothetical protein
VTENAIAAEIVDAAFGIHQKLGPGLFEFVYEAVLAYELDGRGLNTIRQHPIPVIYEEVRMDVGFRTDMIVENKLLTYLRLADKRLGLLINFHVPLIKDGIRRIANNL